MGPIFERAAARDIVHQRLQRLLPCFRADAPSTGMRIAICFAAVLFGTACSGVDDAPAPATDRTNVAASVSRPATDGTPTEDTATPPLDETDTEATDVTTGVAVAAPPVSPLVEFIGYVSSVEAGSVIVVDDFGATVHQTDENSVVQLWIDGNPFPVDLTMVRTGARASGRSISGVIVRIDVEAVPVGCETLVGRIDSATTTTLTVTSDTETNVFALSDTSRIVDDNHTPTESDAPVVAGQAIVVACDNVVRFIDPVY